MRPRRTRRPYVTPLGREWWQGGRWTTPDWTKGGASSWKDCRTLRQAFRVAASCPSGAEVWLPVKRGGVWIEIGWVVGPNPA